jgi:hypothetical protein
MFIFLGWFITVIIVLAVICTIGWGLFMAYAHLSAANDPEVIAFSNAADKLKKRWADDFFETMNLSQDHIEEMNRREREQFENWKNQRPSSSGSHHGPTQPLDCHSVYVIDANGFKTKLKQVS